MLILAGLAGVAAAGYALRDTYVGDAAIYLPYARNAASGHPFEFNPGEFSSGSTSPLWSLLLALPYILGLGLQGAKAFATLTTGLALVVTALAAARLSGSWTAASAMVLLALGTVTFYAVSLYESALVVALSALALLAGARALRGWGRGERAARTILPLVVVWAALPLARPDAVILIAAQALVLVAFAPGPRRRTGLWVLGGLAAAAVPSLAYFGYSLAELGTVSTSSQGRAFALREGDLPRLGPLFLSDAALRELVSSPWLFGLVPALVGLVALWRDRALRWLGVYAGLVLVGYVAVLTFVTPGYYDTPRYLLPLVPVLVAAAAFALARARPRRAWPAVVAAAVLLVGGSSALELRRQADDARSIGITEREVFERDAVAEIDRRARPGDVLLSYEVQLRYFLRDDVSVLSLDGITDGKVAPYQPRGDLTGFLRRYRPDWWIADQNVHTRNYLRGSVLERALSHFEADPASPSVVLDGIRFEPVARRGGPLAPGFGGWLLVVRLGYPASRP